MKRPLASAFALLIALLSPGAPAFEAAAQTVGKTGGSIGASGDAATSVNSGLNAGGLSAPVALPASSLGLNSALIPGAVAPVLSPSAIPSASQGVAIAAPATVGFAQPSAFGGVQVSAAASDVPGAAKGSVPSALTPAAKPSATGKVSGGLSAASKQVEALSVQTQPVLEAVKKGDATGALHGVYENGSSRNELGAVRGQNGTSALRSGLMRSAASSHDRPSEAVPSAAAPEKPTLVYHASKPGNEAKMLALLSRSLQENGYPAYKTKLDRSEANDNDPAVVILAPSSRHKVPVDAEGGRQAEGVVHLVLDASWLIQEVWSDGKTTIRLKKGVVFDEHGQATLVEYEHPRADHYFTDYFTLGANGRDDGVPFEKNLNVAQGNSVQLEGITNDKLITRMLLAEQGIEVPATQAFVMPGHSLRKKLGKVGSGESELTIDAMPVAEQEASRRLNAPIHEFLEQVKFPIDETGRPIAEFHLTAIDYPGAAPRRATVMVPAYPVHQAAFDLFSSPSMTAEGTVTIEAVGVDPSVPGMKTSVTVKLGNAPWLGEKATPLRKKLNAFLNTYTRQELVVKPSGPAYHSGYGVGFFEKAARKAIYTRALALAGSLYMTDDGVVLADSRVNSAVLMRKGRKMETTLRVLGVRTPWDDFVTSGVFARVGPWGKPTTAEAQDPRDNATVEPIEDLLAEWKVTYSLTDREISKLLADIRALGPTAFRTISENEKKRVRQGDEPFHAQSDMIGLDVMIEVRPLANGRVKLVPVVIEVNDQDAGGQYNLDQMYPDQKGEHSRLWVATMIQRARRNALRGKRIMQIGAGYAGKRPIFVRAKELGVKTVLAAPMSPFVASLIKDDLVDEYIEIDDTNIPEARDAIRKKLLASARKNGKLDGITTFWEDNVELTAIVANDLNLPYHSRQSAVDSRSKFQTQKILKSQGKRAARHEILGNLSKAGTPGERDRMLAQFRTAAALVRFPAVLKPVSGAAAIGTEKVNSMEEAVAAYERISALVNPKTDPIFALNSDLLLMQYLDGHEYDVDLVFVNGRPVFESIADNKPTREPSFLATGSRLPSTLSAKKQREAIDQAIEAAKAVGLTDGVLHMEGKYTSEGPRLIEANARMGGSYVHEWVKAVWGVDLAEEGLMAAARIGGKPYKPAKPLIHLDGDFFNADKPGTIKAIIVPDEVKSMPGFVRIREVKHAGDKITLEENGGYARVLMIEAGGKNAAEAKRNLEAIKAKIQVVIE